MSLMLKLLSTLLLLSSLSFASDTVQKVEDFLDEQLNENSRISNVEVNVVDVVDVPKAKNFKAYIVSVKATVQRSSDKKVKIDRRMILFSDGNVVTNELSSLDSGMRLVEYVKPNFKPQYYTKSNLIYGDVNAEHKIAFFSDPLCPFCRSFVPKAIKELKKHPKTFAIYYYHFPLDRIHPASVDLVKAAVVAQEQGVKDVVLKLYDVRINPRETDTKKILAAFNKVMKTNITPKDLQAKSLQEHIENDMDIITKLMVNSTPTVYFDGKADRTKKKYKEFIK